MYMVPQNRWTKIDVTSGHPSAAALQEFLHDCPSGGITRVLSASQTNKARHLQRYGCNSRFCTDQGTLLLTIRYVHPDTREAYFIVEHSTEQSHHGSQNGPGTSTLIAFRDNIQQYALTQEDDDEDSEDSGIITSS